MGRARARRPRWVEPNGLVHIGRYFGGRSVCERVGIALECRVRLVDDTDPQPVTCFLCIAIRPEAIT